MQRTNESKQNAELRGNGRIRRQLGAQAPLQLLADFRDYNSRHDDKFAAHHFARFVVIGELAGNTAILALLVPAEAPVRNRFRADELKTAQQRVPFWDLKFLSQYRDLHEFFVRAERLGHLQNPPRPGPDSRRSEHISRLV